MKFVEVVGQSSLKKQLIQGVQNGRIPHAQIFLGRSGNGALPLAIAYAQYISCTQRGEQDSCGECSSCRKYQSLTHPDLHFSFPFPSNKADISSELIKEFRENFLQNPYMDYEYWMRGLEAENKQGNIPIKECRAIIKSLSLKPFESEYKVLVMWLPEFMGAEGNVLLKLLEEPPQNTLFLLVGEKSERILNTILSRTQPVRVPPIATEAIAERLIEVLSLSADKSQRFAQMAQGDFNLALQLTQETENPYFDQWRNWMGLCYTKRVADASKWADDMSDLGREGLKSFFLYGLEILRGILVYGYTGNQSKWVGQEQEFIHKFHQLKIPASNMEVIIDAIEKTLGNIERNANAKMLLTDLSFTVTRNLNKK